MKSEGMLFADRARCANIFEIFTITKNVLKAAPRQRGVFGSVGRNTASSPIAGRNAQT